MADQTFAVTVTVPLLLQQTERGLIRWSVPGLGMEARPCRSAPDAGAILAFLAERAGTDLQTGLEPLDLSDIPSTTPACVVLDLSAEPPSGEPGWSEPLALRVDALAWCSCGVHCTAVPECDLVVQAPTAAASRALLIRRLHALAERREPGERLTWWLQLAQWRLEQSSVTVSVPLRRPGHVRAEPVLAAVATPARLEQQPALVGCERVVQDLVAALAATPRRLVVVVGAPGVGKSACIAAALHAQQLCRRRAWALDAVRLMVGHPRFPLWSDLLEAVCSEAAEQDAILHLGGLFELCETGQAVGLPFTPADLLRPRLARGEFAAITEATPEELARIQAQRPGLLAHAEIVRVETPDWQRVPAIVRAHVRPQQLDDAALGRLVDLHRRYAPYSAVPARALRCAERLCAGVAPVNAAGVERAFAAETGLPLRLIADDQAWPVEEMRAFLATRVRGQEAAVAAVADALALAKARLDRPGRPLAVLLLAGPTGTGKTSLALALAELLFADRQRLQRFDLSEFATPDAAARLVGGAGSDDGLLVAAIRRQPAGVLLLDEVEKADGVVHDFLLQLAGEGRLSDARGHHADAAGTVVLLTSNLGSASVGGAGFGFAIGSHPPGGAYQAAIDAAFRPELVNRFDAVIVFNPLERAEVAAVAAGRLQQLAGRAGLQRPQHRVTVSDAALDQLAQAATDPRWGARGVLRAIERQVAVPLARALCRLPLPAGVTVTAGEAGALERRVTVEAGAEGIGVTIAQAAAGRPHAPAVAPPLTLGELAEAVPAQADQAWLAEATALLRRTVAGILASPLWFRLQAHATRSAAARHRSRGHGPPDPEAQRAEDFLALRLRIEALDLEAATALLAALDAGLPPEPVSAPALAAVGAAARELRGWLHEEVRRRQQGRAPSGLLVFATHRPALPQLLAGLRTALAGAGRREQSAWIAAAGGGWQRQKLTRSSVLPDGTLALAFDLGVTAGWPAGPALLGHWRLVVEAEGRLLDGLASVLPWSGGEPPRAALRKGFVPQRADDERPWESLLDGSAVAAWLDAAVAELLAEGEA